MAVHERIAEVTERIARRSANTRAAYLARIDRAGRREPRRTLSCGNLAHVVAGCAAAEKGAVVGAAQPHIGIVTAYNDMLSAHVPYAEYPALLKQAIAAAGGTAQVAGGVPAMCDGVIQGQPGMELSLFSRDVIALGTAAALGHDVFDGVLLLGICDKIVPGLLIGALAFGHLPTLFVPAGPMPSGLPNAEKARVRQEFAAGRAGRDTLLAAEMASYHSPGTCTFYGTANSNQLVLEVMGLQLPGSSFVNPDTPLRTALTAAAGAAILDRTRLRGDYRPLGRVVDERALVNGVVGLLASGGSTNLTIHMITVAAAAGLRLTWADFSDIAEVVPLLARVYPNGSADVNQFAAAGGVQLMVRELLGAGLLHADVLTMADAGDLAAYTQVPTLQSEALRWQPGPTVSGDYTVLRGVAEPFQDTSGIKVLHGNLGEAVIKVSAVKPEFWAVEAPALVFDDQDDLLAAHHAGLLQRDFVAVVRFQGPQANGMPELHKLTPTLGLLMDQGFRVALVTDGRMSGASGKVPAAIHLTPEAQDAGPIARICDGDLIRIDARAGTLEVLVDAAVLAARTPAAAPAHEDADDGGRVLFSAFRRHSTRATAGATLFGNLFEEPANHVN